jgi:uncharacterized protein YjbI with pentapeptide repeats
VLISANLRNMDFTAVQLQGAILDGADLREAKFLCAEGKLQVGTDTESEKKAYDSEKRCAELQRTSFISTQLQGAQFTDASLEGARLIGAQLQNTVLDRARLQNAKLDAANLQGASLRLAKLHSASLMRTKLQGAKLVQATLQGADLSHAELQGANLEAAYLQGAWLASAQLQGASLEGAHLEGASLLLAKAQGAVMDKAWLSGTDFGGAVLQAASFSRARLEGAVFDSAVLHGAIFDGASLRGASLRWVGVWRTKLPQTRGPIRLTDPDVGPGIPMATQACSDQSCKWASQDFDKTRKIIEQVPVESYRDRALREFIKLDPGAAFEDEEQMAQEWTRLAASPSSPEAYETSLASELGAAGCAATGAPYVISGLLSLWEERFSANSPHPSAVATAFLNKARCPGAAGLSEDDRAKLRAMQKPAAPKQ